MAKIKITKRRVILGLAVILIIGASLAYPFLAVGSAYKARIVCSAIFLSGRDEASVLGEDVSANSGQLSLLNHFDVKIDYQNHSVTSSFLGTFSRTAVFRDGIGTTLAIDVSPEVLLAEKSPTPAPIPLDPDVLWPEGERVDPAKNPPINTVVASAFDEPKPDEPRLTRAIVVVHNGHIIAEQYAPGFTSDTPLLGWSMTKSVTNALVGILVRQGKISLKKKDLLSLWRKEGNPKADITLDQLLHMSSGLEFREKYDYDNHVTAMLFRNGDTSAYAAAKPLIHSPGKHYDYSSGTTNIISRIIRETINDDQAYHAFPYLELLHPIGARSAIIERDASGTFVGSSFMYATARDWARIGLLYANDGLWNGDQRILPERWMEYSRTAAPADCDKKHGAHFWLRFAKTSPLPEGTFHMSGHEGQFVTIIPEEKLVVVRLGLTRKKGGWKQEEFVSEILKALKKQGLPRSHESKELAE